MDSLNILDEMLRMYYYRELLENNEPRVEPIGLKGITGRHLHYFVDELNLFGNHVPSWTPKQFGIMWDQFSHRTRVQYIKNLMDGQAYPAADARVTNLI